MSAERVRSSLGEAVPSGGEPAYRKLGHLLRVVMRGGTKEVWDDAAALPATGGVLVVSNHVSVLDPIAVGRYLIWAGRWPRFLGKKEIWDVPALGQLARACKQIPVHRGTSAAKDSLAAAKEALNAGECIVIYPEGTRTRDPELWPMAPRTGAARLALATGVPVIPVAHWGTHEVMPGRKLTIPRIFPKRTVHVVMGEPVDLSDLLAKPDDLRSIADASRRIMAAVTALVEQLRGESAPAGVWNAKQGRRV